MNRKFDLIDVFTCISILTVIVFAVKVGISSCQLYNLIHLQQIIFRRITLILDMIVMVCFMGMYFVYKRIRNY